MCSERREEVGAVKSELFKAGIRSEVRENPVTAALGITRLELWVDNGSDYYAAHRLYTRMQARSGNGQPVVEGEDSDGNPVEVELLPPRSKGSANGRGMKEDGKTKGQSAGSELEEASLQLEKEIDELLKREDTLTATCAELRTQVESLSRSLSKSQSAAEEKAAEFTTKIKALDQELAERKRTEEQLKGQVNDLQQRLKSGEASHLERQKRLESTLQQLQTQQAMVVELRKEIVTREQQWESNNRLVSKAQAELQVEKESRIAAEEKLAELTRAQEHLERQLEDQKKAQSQLRSSVGNLNSLRDRLQAKRNSIRA